MFKVAADKHVVTAADVTAGSIAFHFGDAFQVKGAVVQVRTAAGALKNYDGAVTHDPETVTIDNSGAADFAATDVVSVIAYG